jgi:CBS domain-containing protein
MTVASILAVKGRDVYTTGPDTIMSKAIDELASKKIGAIVVVDSDKMVCGIISERDIVRELARSGPSVLEEPISTCMTRTVISCSESNTVDEVMAIMTTNRFRHLPVVSGDRLSGIISIGDVVKRKIEQAERDAEELRHYIATA